jgi:hypothetical protein
MNSTITDLESNKIKMEKKLGKIERVTFGYGGYQDSMIGISVTLSGESWGVSDFEGYWDAERVKHSEHTQWSEDDRSKVYDETMRLLSKLLKEAKVDSVEKLKGKPVEVTFDGNRLQEWRILTEVL